MSCGEFPSPCGDYGSYQFKHRITSEVLPAMFPSPCGDYGSYPAPVTRRIVERVTGSFRPLAGIMVLICLLARITLRQLRLVSVPLRGLWFLSSTLRQCNQPHENSSFRPLAGIMVLIARGDVDEQATVKSCFRPLAGIMVLIANCLQRKTRNLIAVSVPLRGLWFLSLTNFINDSVTLYWCFRPLAGIMVLIERT